MADNQELAKQLRDNLISLKLDLAAHAGVLRNSVIRDQSGNLLDWKKTVESHRKDLDNSRAEDLYSDISNPILSAKPECAQVLRALLDLVKYQGTLERLGN